MSIEEQVAAVLAEHVPFIADGTDPECARCQRDKWADDDADIAHLAAEVVKALGLRGAWMARVVTPSSEVES